MLLWLLSKAKGLFSLLTGEKIHNWKKKKQRMVVLKIHSIIFTSSLEFFTSIFVFSMPDSMKS